MGWLFTLVFLVQGAAAPQLTDAVLDRGLVDVGDTTRLARAMLRAQSGEAITVGVIGGSITQGALASDGTKCWGALTAGWFRDAFPQSEVAFVNAGIGATASDLGAHRVGPHLLAEQPDVVVVEYAVNDGGNTLAEETLEGLVRQLLQGPNAPAVVLFFTMDRAGQSRQLDHERVGRHYGLPMVSLRDALWPEVESGTLAWSDFEADEVHPNDLGHRYSSQLLAHLFQRVKDGLASAGASAGSAPPALPAPLTRNGFEHARLLTSDRIAPTRNEGWTGGDEKAYFGAGWQTDRPGSVLEFSVSGEAVSVLFWRIKGAMGQAEAWVDDGEPVLLEAWFGADWGGYTPFQLVARDLSPGAHTLHVRLLDTRHAESAGHAFQLLAVMTAGLEAPVSPLAASLRRALDHLCRAFPETYPRGREYLQRWEALVARGDEAGLALLQREALLDHPLLRFERLLLVKRGEKQLGLPQNWEGNSSLPRGGYDNEIGVLTGPWTAPTYATLYRPRRGAFVGDLDLHYDGERLLFSQSDVRDPWQLQELSLEEATPRALPLIDEPDVDNYDGCYLPDGNLIFSSTAPFVGVPCVTGSSHVTNLYHYTSATGHIRRLTFEQDHNWCPTVLPNGRVLYLRWEYSDIPHFASRILFHMNPDGTEQMEYYGSNSYWPNAMFYARPIPGSTTKFITVVGGHHGVPRMGELTLFDITRGRREAEGAVQRIPGWNQAVEPVLLDNLVDESWPRFLHPWPLDDSFFLVSCKLTPASPWGLYLADVFDNLVPILEAPGYALFEPIPVQSQPLPPAIPAKVDLKRQDALVYVADLYTGPGLEGVPRGTVKSLRLFTYHFAYHGMGGQINRVGLDGPWDIKRVLGTTPVEADGSAFFRVPANTPISIQPLDGEGKAVQLMRSWMTAMPGETLSCVGCHEAQNTAPNLQATLASRRAPTEIAPWRGPERGFSFIREVQPVLDTWCVSCHDGAAHHAPPDFRPLPPVHPEAGDAAYRDGTKFTPAYLALRRYVRAPSMESDLHLLPPYEFHADTTPLVQLLQQGHHSATLDEEAWDRLITWIDLGAPAHGTWHEIVGPEKVFAQRDRRRAMLAKYAPGAENDPEAIVGGMSMAEAEALPSASETSGPDAAPTAAPAADVPVQDLTRRSLDLGNGMSLELVLIPAGSFVMGDSDGRPNEGPAHEQIISEAFWLGRTEVTNAQYACFEPGHDSRLEHGDFLQFSVAERGYPVNGPEQPVVRVSWRDAMAFCAWLAARAGEPVSLPTEAQWEYACRAGAAGPFWYGDDAVDFSATANLADYSLAHIDSFPPWNLPVGALYPYRPARMEVNDGHRVSAPVGSFRPNPWNLLDMHGNAAEWTRDVYRPYPHAAGPASAEPGMGDEMAVRGGSWYDTPRRARASARRAYPSWQRVFDVGFRVCVPVSTLAQQAAEAPMPNAYP